MEGNARLESATQPCGQYYCMAEGLTMTSEKLARVRREFDCTMRGPQVLSHQPMLPVAELPQVKLGRLTFSFPPSSHRNGILSRLGVS